MQFSDVLKTSPTKAPLCSLHFVLLHHGYRGKAVDLEYLWETSEMMLQSHNANNTEHDDNGLPAPTPRLVFIPPKDNDGSNMDAGVWACAHRYIDHVCVTVSTTVAKVFSVSAGQSFTSVEAVCDTGDGGPPATRYALHFSAVGHSMGGLILRAAFPTLMERIDSTYVVPSQGCEVHWEAFYTLASPHLGVYYMLSNFATFLGRWVGHHMWTAVADLFCKNDVVNVDLVSEESLAAWARFKRRVMLNVVNDGSVLTYSSSFVVPVHVLKRVGATQPTEGTCANALSTRADKTDAPGADSVVCDLGRLGFRCASSKEELRSNGVLLTEISPERWPPGVLPKERALAERILRHVAPLELHFIDFRPAYTRMMSPGPTGAGCGEGAPQIGFVAGKMIGLGAHNFAHGALTCQSPFKYPSVFGFVSEYIAEDLLAIPSRRATQVPLAQ